MGLYMEGLIHGGKRSVKKLGIIPPIISLYTDGLIFRILRYALLFRIQLVSNNKRMLL